MNLLDLQTLLDYHYWSRDRLLDAVARLPPAQLNQDLANSFPSIFDTLRHLIGAEMVWESRWRGDSLQTMPELLALADVSAIRRAWTEQESKIRATVSGLGEAGVQQPIEYRSFTGQTQAQPFWQMLQHLVNHGSYHRGQITTMLRQLHAEPPKSMDLIAFYRERGALLQ